jgi:hypothetical protein
MKRSIEFSSKITKSFVKHKITLCKDLFLGVILNENA